MPLFIEPDTKVKVDTRDGSYLGRVNDQVAARGKARKRALDILFEADARAVPVGTVLAEQVRRREVRARIRSTNTPSRSSRVYAHTRRRSMPLSSRPPTVGHWSGCPW